MHIIEDTRWIEEFRNKTFSGYKLTDVKKALTTNMLNNNIEQTAELITN